VRILECGRFSGIPDAHPRSLPTRNGSAGFDVESALDHIGRSHPSTRRLVAGTARDQRDRDCQSIFDRDLPDWEHRRSRGRTGWLVGSEARDLGRDRAVQRRSACLWRARTLRGRPHALPGAGLVGRDSDRSPRPTGVVRRRAPAPSVTVASVHPRAASRSAIPRSAGPIGGKASRVRLTSFYCSSSGSGSASM